MCMVTNNEVEVAGSELWVKRDGTKVKVSEMSDEHVRNAFTALLKKIRLKSQSKEVEFETKDNQSEE